MFLVQPVGCNLILGSDVQEDKCRICGGDGSTCNTITGDFMQRTLTVGYNDIVLIPAGATNIYVEEIKSSHNYLGEYREKEFAKSMWGVW